MRMPMALLLVALSLGAWADQERWSEIDAMLERFDATTPGLVVGLVEGGELVHARSAGMANLSFGIPFETDSPTNIGSTAKQFTGYALALLHEQGKLSLDDDIRDYFPNLPDFGETVTLRHLLTHTSGYREFLNALVLGGRDLINSDWIEADEAIALIERQPELQNAPGAEWNYNNTGYVLAARVIEQVTETPFVDWMRQEIFEPLGMTRTQVRPAPNVPIAGGTTGYRKDDERYVEARDIGGAAGAGGVYTTAGDMARWMGQLGSFELGGPAVRELMSTPYVLSNGEATNYSLGLMIDEWRGLARWQHGGGDMGHLSAFFYFPELDKGYLVFANHHDLDGAFFDQVGEVFLAAHIEVDEEDAGADSEVSGILGEDAFSDELFDRYAGRYELEVMPGFILHFFREEERYMIQATGQPAFPIEPIAANIFSIEVVDARIEFHLDEDDSVDSLTLFQNGEHRAVRVDTNEENGPELTDFVGRYFSPELETFYEIRLEDDQLQLVHRRFGPLSLSHSADDRFTATFPVSQVDFLRGEDGQVEALKAGNGRSRDLRFDRVE